MPDPDLPKGIGWHLLPISTAGDPASSLSAEASAQAGAG